MGEEKKVHGGAGLCDSKPQTVLSGFFFPPHSALRSKMDTPTFIHEICIMCPLKLGLQFRVERREDRCGNEPVLGGMRWISWMLGMERSRTQDTVGKGQSSASRASAPPGVAQHWDLESCLMATARVDERPPSRSWAKLRVSPPVSVSAELSGPGERSEGQGLKKEANSWEEADPTSGQAFTSLVPTSLVLCDSHAERLISFL